MPQHAGSRFATQIAALFSQVSGGVDNPPHRDNWRRESMIRWTFRLRWKGQTIEIEIEIGLNL
jgi:hypothetical protein